MGHDAAGLTWSSRFRRTFAPKGPDRFVVNLGNDEREVIQAVCEDLGSVLDDGAANPALRRLFPTAHATDADVDREYQEMVHDDLLGSRREILAAVAASTESTTSSTARRSSSGWWA